MGRATDDQIVALYKALKAHGTVPKQDLCVSVAARLRISIHRVKELIEARLLK